MVSIAKSLEAAFASSFNEFGSVSVGSVGTYVAVLGSPRLAGSGSLPLSTLISVP